MTDLPIRQTVSRSLAGIACALLIAFTPMASAGEPSDSEGVPCLESALGFAATRVCAIHSGPTPDGADANAIASADLDVATLHARAFAGESTWSETGSSGGAYSSDGVGVGLGSWGYVPVGEIVVPFYLTALILQGDFENEYTEGGMQFHRYRRVTQAWVETMGVGGDVGQTETSRGGGDEWRLTGGRVYAFSPVEFWYYHPLLPFPISLGERYTEAYAGQINEGAGCRMVVHVENGVAWLGWTTLPATTDQDLGPCVVEASDAPDVPGLPPPPPSPGEIIEEVLP